MKKLLLLVTAITLAACHKQQDIPPDSVYNVDTQWQTQKGSKIKFKDLAGKVLVTAMIYTNCRTSCPRLTAEMKAIAEKAGDTDPAKLQYVLISIDPGRDTPAVMRDFLKNYNLADNRWLFLRGSEEDTRELANVMAVRYKKITPMEFSHSNIISVYSKTGRLAYQQEGLNSDGEEAIVKEIHVQLKR